MPIQTKIYKWVTLLLAFILVLIGLYIFMHPFEFIATFVHILALCLISIGVVDLAYNISFNRCHINDGYVWKIVRNILNIIFGILLVRYRLTAAFATVIIIGAWLFFFGCAKVVYSVKMKKYGILNWTLGIIIGVVGMTLGIVAVLAPHFWTIVTAYVVGVAMIFLGIVFASEFFVLY